MATNLKWRQRQMKTKLTNDRIITYFDLPFLSNLRPVFCCNPSPPIEINRHYHWGLMIRRPKASCIITRFSRSKCKITRFHMIPIVITATVGRGHLTTTPITSTLIPPKPSPRIKPCFHINICNSRKEKRKRKTTH
jgi:hypothetical protein